MLLEIKLYGGLISLNENLDSFGMRKFSLKLEEAAPLGEIHKLLHLSPMSNLVSIVNGRAQLQDYVIGKDCSISIFPPMADRKYNPFEKL